MKVCKHLLALCCLGFSGALWATAASFQAPMDVSRWTVDSSIFECRMTHDIPFYGAAVFERMAGESAHFQLQPRSSRLKSGRASLVSVPPLWKPQGKAVDLGWVSVVQGLKPVTLGSGRSERLLGELFAGQKLVFTRAPWYGAEGSARVALSSVNFQAAYRQYLGCLTQLLPVNFDQIARTAIYFPSGHDELRPSEMRKLENVVIYVTADTSVESFYIDGHTDSVGPRSENLELSKARAEMVTQYLVQRGISADRISTRWHGERYGVASNRSRKGRAQNRRVTIRLEKAGGPRVPPLAQAEGE